jgi:predicted permease
MHGLRARLGLLSRRAAETRMAEEIRFHLEMETEKLVREGLSPEEARRRAVLAFGGVEGHKEAMRDTRGVRSLENLWRDLRHALRTLWKTPYFSLVAVLTLALGIGAVTALFAMVNAILIQPLPYPRADRLVAVSHAAPGLGLAETGLSSGTYFLYRDRARSFQGLALYEETVLNLSGAAGPAERVQVTYTGPELFQILGVRPELGRLFTTEDGRPGFMDGRWTIPVLLSHDLWQQRFGGDPGIIDRIVTLNDLPRIVVGVMPPGFAFPRPETQVWMLMIPPAETANFAQQLSYSAVGRLRPGVAPESAQAELQRLLPSIAGLYPDATPTRIAEVGLRPEVVPLKRVVVGGASRALWVLLGGMGVLLLVACANVANLFLVRAEHRAREVAVRTALGARRLDLARLFLCESLLLSLAGAATGLLLAAGGLSALVAFAPVELPRLHEVRIDGWVLAFTTGIAVLVALLFGGVSLLRQARSAMLAPTLRNGGSRVADRRGRGRVRDLLVASQTALALLLLAGSALMVQSFARLMRVDPGFDPSDVLTVEIGLPYRMAGDYPRVYGELLEQVRALPGVQGAAAASSLPLSGEGPYEYPLRVEGRAAPGYAPPAVRMKFVTPRYFQVMRIPVVDGSSLLPRERPEVPNPVLVSAALARRLFPGESPIGKQVRRLDSDGEPPRLFDPSTGSLRTTPPYTIAGVVADVRETSLREAPPEILYVPVLDPPVEPSVVPTEMTLVLRTAVPPLSLAPAVRLAVADVDPALSVARIRTLDAIVRASTARESFLMALLLAAATASLLLGSVGIYGVVAYVVRRRTQEIGIRVALGARAGRITGLVLRELLCSVLVGALVGLAGTFAGTRVLRSLLFGVSPTDPLTLAAVTALLLCVALLAGLIPARRAARVDPMVALRAE